MRGREGGGVGRRGREKKSGRDSQCTQIRACIHMYIYAYNFNSPDMTSIASSRKKFLSGSFSECNLRSARIKFYTYQDFI